MEINIAGLIERAAGGDKKCMDELVENIQPRLHAYVLRCTLNKDLTEDILQEAMLQMITSLTTLNNYERFWPWLYRIASNKISSHFRKTKQHAAIHFSTLENHLLESVLQDDNFDAIEKPLLKEFRGIIFNAIEKLHPQQRAILSLRCFEDMPYSQIAEVTNCSESNARVLFLRARNKVKCILSKQGITGKAMLLALVLFGKLTAGEALAATITTTSIVLETGLTATEIFILSLKHHFLKYVTAAAVILAAVFLWYWFQMDSFPMRSRVNSAYFVVQGVGLLSENLDTNSRRDKANTDSGLYYSKGAYEEWLRFPEGPDGPVQVRMQRWLHIAQQQKACAWLQDGTCNYYYHCGSNTIYLTNDPISMLILPTDPPEMINFILEHASSYENVKYCYDAKTGLLKSKIDNRVPDIKDYTTRYTYNGLNENDFAPFWPKNAKTIDERDCMHKRGWTYFTFEGTPGGLVISGKGMIPFSYDASKKYKPWLQLNIGNSIQIVDTDKGAFLSNAAENKTVAYPAGAFFAGLSRPWCGIRTYDTVQRDAAMNKIPFKAERTGEKATITLNKDDGYVKYQIVYHIDMAKDVIEQIYFTRTDESCTEGKLVFTYAQELESWPTVFETPSLPAPAASTQQEQITYWHLWLLEQIPAFAKFAYANNP